MNIAELKKMVGLAEPFLMVQDFIPILQHFWFHPDHLTAYNDVQAIQLDFRSMLHCAVPGKILCKLLATIRADEVEVTQDDKQGVLLIGSGRNKTKLPILPKEEFVFTFPTARGIEVRVDDSFRDGFESCLSTVSQNPTQPERNGLSIQVERDRITIYTTDGISISRFRVEGRFSVSELDEFWAIMPTFFCQQLMVLMKHTQLPAALYFQEGGVVAAIGPHYLFSRLINAKPPQFEAALAKLIPVELTEFQLVPIPDELPHALSRACLMTYPEKNIKSSVVTVDDAGLMTLLTESDKGRAYDELATDIRPTHGKPIRFSVDPHHLMRACGLCKKFSLHDTVMIFSADNQQFFHLVSMQTA